MAKDWFSFQGKTMAVYFNLAIDCDQDGNSAKEFARHFHEFTITTERFGELKCDSEHTHPRFYWGNRGTPSDDTYAGDWHKVCVSPKGMSMPVGNTPGILDEQNMNHVRNELYQHLQRGVELGNQFRSAFFGWEAQDYIGETDWLEQLESINQTGKLPRGAEGLILSSNLIKNESVKTQLEFFAEGYLWWNAPARGH